MSLEGDLEQVLVEALVVVLLQFGFSAGSCGVAPGEHVVLDWVEEAHSEFTGWM
jgi:autotransporter translocation and assembly factor TamB